MHGTLRSLAAASFALLALPVRAQHAGHGGSASAPAAEAPRHEPGRAPALIVPTPGPRQVQVTISEAGIEPREIRAEAGDSVTLLLRRTTERTCAKEINFVGRGVQVAVPLELEVRVTIDVNEPGQFRFGCLGGAESAVIRVAANSRP